MKSRFQKRFSTRLNSVVVFQKKEKSGKGIDRAVTWTDVCSVWAEIIPVSAGEIIRHNREDMKISHRIRLRYQSGLSSDMRIVFGTRKFDINSIISVDGQNRKIEILAEEVVG